MFLFAKEMERRALVFTYQLNKNIIVKVNVDLVHDNACPSKVASETQSTHYHWIISVR